VQVLFDLRREARVTLYYNEGLTLIPLQKMSGVPLVPYKQYEDPNNRPSWQQTEEWFFGNENGIAVLLGAASDYAFCLDDDEGILPEITDGNPDALHTLRELGPDSKRSHVFLKDRSCNIRKLDFRLCAKSARPIQAEIKGNGQLVTLAPSLHRKSHLPYRTVSPTYVVREIDGVIELVIQKFKELGWKPPEELARSFDYRSLIFRDGKAVLPQEYTEEISNIAMHLWRRGQRQKLQTALIGWLLRAGISSRQVEAFVLEVVMHCAEQRDNESWNRRLQEIEIKGAIDALQKNRRVYGLRTLRELAASLDCEATSKQLLGLNRKVRKMVSEHARPERVRRYFEQ
jgi:hypothetical protein